MPVTFALIEPALAALRGVVTTAYGIAASVPIPEAGDDPVRPNEAKLPMAILEVDGDVKVFPGDSQHGGGARNVTEVMTVHCWIVRRKSRGVRDVAALRVALGALVTAIYADPRLGGAVTNAEVTAVDWTGKAREAPFEIVAGQALQGGYVSVEIWIVETR